MVLAGTGKSFFSAGKKARDSRSTSNARLSRVLGKMAEIPNRLFLIHAANVPVCLQSGIGILGISYIAFFVCLASSFVLPFVCLACTGKYSNSDIECDCRL